MARRDNLLPHWQRHRRNRAIAGAGAGVALLLVAVGTVAASGDEAGVASTGSSAAVSTAWTAWTESSPTTVTYRGSGDDVVSVRKPEAGPLLITISGSGSPDNLVVRALGRGIETTDLLVNDVGAYTGTQILDPDEGDETRRIRVSYPGSWKITLAPLDDARRVDKPSMSGRGADVFFYGGPTARAVVEHAGASTFAVRVFGDDGLLRLLDETGRHAGEQVLTGSSFVQVEADDEWTINPR